MPAFIAGQSRIALKSCNATAALSRTAAQQWQARSSELGCGRSGASGITHANAILLNDAFGHFCRLFFYLRRLKPVRQQTIASASAQSMWRTNRARSLMRTFFVSRTAFFAHAAGRLPV